MTSSGSVQKMDKKIQMYKVLSFVFCLALIGCSTGPQSSTPSTLVQKVVKAATPSPDPFLASEMVKKFPKLQKICDLAGGCQNVEITCTIYDGTGNSNLRNETVWTVSALGTEGAGFKSQGGFAEAIGDEYPGWFGMRKLEAKMTDHPEVFPNSKPCDANCKP